LQVKHGNVGRIERQNKKRRKIGNKKVKNQEYDLTKKYPERVLTKVTQNREKGMEGGCIVNNSELVSGLRSQV